MGPLRTTLTMYLTIASTLADDVLNRLVPQSFECCAYAHKVVKPKLLKWGTLCFIGYKTLRENIRHTYITFFFTTLYILVKTVCSDPILEQLQIWKRHFPNRHFYLFIWMKCNDIFVVVGKLVLLITLTMALF